MKFLRLIIITFFVFSFGNSIVGKNNSEKIFKHHKKSLNNNAGSWYFYNSDTVAFGENNFMIKWGNRKLADNWRRCNRNATWYWYHPSTIAFGDSCFVKKWGDRKLEDNWRRQLGKCLKINKGTEG